MEFPRAMWLKNKIFFAKEARRSVKDHIEIPGRIKMNICLIGFRVRPSVATRCKYSSG